VRTFSVLDPLRTLVQELQDYAPTVLITYPSCAAALAQQQSEGILKLSLTEIWLGGEQLSGEQRLQIRSAFGCPLRNNYGSSEFFSMAWECRHGALHMNSDWLILEPVDRKLRPVPVGEPSHSVLLTNLANHVQPLLRYRLGDSVRFVASPCSCGSQFPVIEVQGRADYTLALQDNEGHELTVLPLALITAIEEAAQVTQFQILRTSPDTLEIRLETEVPQAAAAFKRARDALAAFLARHGLSNVRITHGKGTPLRQPHSGKLCRVMDNTTANSSRPHPQARSPHIIVH
jgi:phenylacetate-CoA ligase